MSEHKKTITAISWCPHNPDMFASASADSLVIIWNVTEQKVVAKLDNTKGTSNMEIYLFNKVLFISRYQKYLITQ